MVRRPDHQGVGVGVNTVHRDELEDLIVGEHNDGPKDTYGDGRHLAPDQRVVNPSMWPDPLPGSVTHADYSMVVVRSPGCPWPARSVPSQCEDSVPTRY